jgi:tetratricopeptide (TPR) repeat protein
MTTHIFLRSGMWDETVAANRAGDATWSTASAAPGMPPVQCGHYAEWLVYAEYQQGRGPRRTRRSTAVAPMRDRRACPPRRAGSGAIEPMRSSVLSWADMAVRRLTETGHWTGQRASHARGRYLATRLTLAYGDLLAAGADPARIRAARSRLEAAHTAWAAPESRAGRDAPRRDHPLQARALDQLASGEAEAGLATLRQAAATERDIPAEFGPPLVEKPSFELLGDVLARMGRLDEARQAYASALALAPGRRLAMQGAAAEAVATR